MSDVIPAIGATCLGVVMGWLIRYFIRRFKTFTPAVLGSVVTILVGGVIVDFLARNRDTLWFYPIGLLIGFIVYQTIMMTMYFNQMKSAKDPNVRRYLRQQRDNNDDPHNPIGVA